MRIALDATYSTDLQPSGVGVYSEEILHGLVREYPENSYVFCYRWKQWRRSSGRLPPNIQRRLLQPAVPTFRADLFHALNQRVDKRPASKVVSTFHDLFVLTGDYASPEFKERFTRQAQRAAKNSDLVIAVSEFTADQVSSILGFDRSRIRVIPHGVSLLPDARGPVPRSEPRLSGSCSREKIILSVGTLQKRKNTARLVEAFEGLSRDWRLVLAGSPTGYGANEILHRIENSHSRERIQVTGYLTRAKLDALYKSASIFAFPSLDEGFGIPVLEAMANGLPVVTSNRSAMPEIAGDAALLIDPQQTQALQTALRSLIENEEFREKLSKAGRTRASLFTWERAVRETYQLYKELVP